jgi:hypothetical protein
MEGPWVMAAFLVGGTLLAVSASGAEQPQQAMPPGCAKIVAVLDESGGGLSADEVARKANTDVETVRNCTDLWRRTMQQRSATKGADQPMPPGCAKIVAVLDESGGGLSADEVAKRTSTDVETVHSCTDLWRRTMKGGPAP